MAISDPIADMLTRIRNAVKAKHKEVKIPGSKLKIEITKLLKSEGYIQNYKIVENSKQGIIVIYLKFSDTANLSGIMKIDRVSKPGRRVYNKVREIKSVYNGMGISILSTSRGLMTDKEAKRKNIGGELICTVW